MQWGIFLLVAGQSSVPAEIDAPLVFNEAEVVEALDPNSNVAEDEEQAVAPGGGNLALGVAAAVVVAGVMGYAALGHGQPAENAQVEAGDTGALSQEMILATGAAAATIAALGTYKFLLSPQPPSALSKQALFTPRNIAAAAATLVGTAVVCWAKWPVEPVVPVVPPHTSNPSVTSTPERDNLIKEMHATSKYENPGCVHYKDCGMTQAKEVEKAAIKVLDVTTRIIADKYKNVSVHASDAGLTPLRDHVRTGDKVYQEMATLIEETAKEVEDAKKTVEGGFPKIWQSLDSVLNDFQAMNTNALHKKSKPGATWSKGEPVITLQINA